MKYLYLCLLSLFLLPATVYAATIVDAETAIKAEDANALEKMLADGLDLHEHDAQGNSLFYFALVNTHSADILRLLADNGADLNAPVPATGETPLLYAVAAAERIQAEAAQVFTEELRPENRAEMEDDFKQAAVTEMKHAAKVVRLLIELGADVNQETPVGTPLMRAATNPWNSEIVGILLEAGADVNQPDQNGRTALFYAEAYGCADISIQLIAAGADVYFRDSDGKTYLEVDKKDLLPAEIIHDM